MALSISEIHRKAEADKALKKAEKEQVGEANKANRAEALQKRRDDAASAASTAVEKLYTDGFGELTKPMCVAIAIHHFNSFDIKQGTRVVED